MCRTDGSPLGLGPRHRGGSSPPTPTMKILNCTNCGKAVSVNKRASKVFCKKCKQGRKRNRWKINHFTKNRKCPDCNKLIKDKNKSGYCSACVNKHLKDNPNWQSKLSKAVLVRIANGTHKGWQSRNILSFPEKFFIQVLKNNNLIDKCKINHPIKQRDLDINNSMNYFLDFFFEDKKLDVEIDGGQHKLPNRQIKDKIRDERLTQHGIKVYRIKWKDPAKSKANKIYIKEEIEKFLDFMEPSNIS